MRPGCSRDTHQPQKDLHYLEHARRTRSPALDEPDVFYDGACFERAIGQIWLHPQSGSSRDSSRRQNSAHSLEHARAIHNTHSTFGPDVFGESVLLGLLARRRIMPRGVALDPSKFARIIYSESEYAEAGSLSLRAFCSDQVPCEFASAPAVKNARTSLIKNVLLR